MTTEGNSNSISGLVRAIRERRTIRDFNGQPLDKDVILDILRDAQWAPFHSRKEPWRFILFTGEGRLKFAEAVSLTYSAEVKERWGDWARNQYCNFMQAHLIVIFAADPRQKYWEDALSATAALIQNIQLLAWEREIGVVWKTNECNWDPAFHRIVGVKPDERIAGILHFGYFDQTPKPRKRMAIEQCLTLIDT
jgi:nitroreductase